jgi:hypothetical protein
MAEIASSSININLRLGLSFVVTNVCGTKTKNMKTVGTGFTIETVKVI